MNRHRRGRWRRHCGRGRKNTVYLIKLPSDVVAGDTVRIYGHCLYHGEYVDFGHDASLDTPEGLTVSARVMISDHSGIRVPLSKNVTNDNRSWQLIAAHDDNLFDPDVTGDHHDVEERRQPGGFQDSVHVGSVP